MAKKKPSMGLINTLINLVQASGNILRNLLQLVLLEFDLAKRSFLLIVILLLLMFGLLISSWCYALALGVYWLITLHVTVLVALAIMLSFNLLLLLVTILLIGHYRQDLLFPATRRQLQRLKKLI